MKIKMADVARHLGISKATVSLAVNGKPGVNEQTRQRIFQCIEEMKKNDGMIPDVKKNDGTLPEVRRDGSPLALKIIKVVVINHRKRVIGDPELGVWPDILSTFDAEARKRGYLYGLTYLNEQDAEQQAIIEECNMDMVAGIILFGTEMSSVDYEMIRRIHKPLVLFDYEIPDGSYSSVCIDNGRAVEMALEALIQSGASDIRYLSTGKDIYNFEKRREAFQNTMMKAGNIPLKNDTVPLGNTTEEIMEQAFSYLGSHKLPDAFVMENYQVSIGVLNAIQRLGIKVPETLKLVGIDELPGYVVSNIKLTQIRIPHVERAAMAIGLLDREISMAWNAKIRALVIPELLPGETI